MASMTASPTKLHPRLGMIRRAQSTDCESHHIQHWPDNGIFRQAWADSIAEAPKSSSNSTAASNAPQDRLDSIFRKTNNPKSHMSPIGTRQKLLTEDRSIRPSLSCPAAVFKSPLRNLLEPLEGIHSDSSEVLEVSAIEFDDEASALNQSLNIGAVSMDALDNINPLNLDSFPRNLNNAFDLLMERKEEPVMVTMEGVSVPIISLPAFRLAPALTASLSPGLVARVSFYSIVRDINKEASDCMATDPAGREVIAEDGRVHVHPTEEEKSVLFGHQSVNSNSLLDEEWFLLSAIASRSKAEVEANLEGLLPTFAEAMGEASTRDESGSRTQLWKPGRSWWEAKSGKNPWVEPVVHNNRWRYLWPLIHYHKFIAKCIKKLKRNGVDVKTSPSTVSVFLRQEVCHVSDHLAFMSKYDSEEWTNALRNFDGWTDHDPKVEETIRSLVLCQRLVTDTSDVCSSLLKSQLQDAVIKSMQAVKEEAAKAAASENYDYGKGHGGSNHSHHGHVRVEDDVASQNSFVIGAQQHHNGHAIHRSWSGSTANPQSATKSKQGRRREGSWREDHPQSYHNPGMYGPQYDHPPHYSHPYGPPMESQYYHQYNQYSPHHHMGYHHGGDIYHEGQYGHHELYYGYYDGRYHDGMVLDSSMHSEHHMHPSAMVTPSRYGEHPQYQMSPFHHEYWGHLNISQLPGLAPSPSMHTPSKPPRGNPNRSFLKRQGKNISIDGKAKSLILFPKQANSPASRFVMSPQDKSNHPYYSERNFQSSNLNNSGSGQEESFVLPTIEDFAHDSPTKPMNGVELGVPPGMAYVESRNEEVDGQSTED